MRIECPSCLEVAESRLVRVAQNAATFVCGACDVEVSATVSDSSTHASPAEADMSAGENACPKCQQHVPSATSHCPGCGLRREKFATFDGGETEVAPEILAAWKRVESNWSSNPAHEDFAAEVSLSGRYSLGARFYRKASASHERAAKAREMLDRMQTMATAALLSSKPKVAEEEQPYKNVVIVLIVMLVLAAGVGLILMRGQTGSADARPSQPRGH